MWAVLVAAGRGRRMGGELPKQYLKVAGKTLLEHSLQLLDQAARVEGIMLVLSSNDENWNALNPEIRTPLHVVSGGAERSDSVLAGLEALYTLCSDDDWVLVHDAARICLKPADIDAMESALLGHECGGLLAVPVRDTIKLAQGDAVVRTVERSQLWQAQTPQVFRYGLLASAMKTARANGESVTDEAMAMELAGHRPKLLEGRSYNIKITVPEDIQLAEYILSRQGEMD